MNSSQTRLVWKALPCKANTHHSEGLDRFLLLAVKASVPSVTLSANAFLRTQRTSATLTILTASDMASHLAIQNLTAASRGRVQFEQVDWPALLRDTCLAKHIAHMAKAPAAQQLDILRAALVLTRPGFIMPAGAVLGGDWVGLAQVVGAHAAMGRATAGSCAAVGWAEPACWHGDFMFVTPAAAALLQPRVRSSLSSHLPLLSPHSFFPTPIPAITPLPLSRLLLLMLPPLALTHARSARPRCQTWLPFSRTVACQW